MWYALAGILGSSKGVVGVLAGLKATLGRHGGRIDVLLESDGTSIVTFRVAA